MHRSFLSYLYWSIAVWGLLAPLSAAAQGVTVPEPLLIEDPLGRWMAFLDLNNAGTAVGVLTDNDANVYVAFSWSQTTGIVELAQPSTFGSARAINDCGEIAGEAGFSASEGAHAARWRRSGELEDLGTLGGNWSGASDINDRGTIVGGSEIATQGVSEAFIWTRSEGMRGLGTLGGANSIARAVNERDEVVGWAETADGFDHAFFWSRATGMIDLGTLGRSASDAFAINDRGVVVGLAGNGIDEKGLGFAWTQRHGLVPVVGEGDRVGLPRAIDEDGLIVGETIYEYDAEQALIFGSETRRATLWIRPDLPVDLDPGYGLLSGAFSINDRGQILGIVSLGNLNHTSGLLWQLDRKQLEALGHRVSHPPCDCASYP